MSFLPSLQLFIILLLINQLHTNYFSVEAAETELDGKLFLEANAKKEGVTVLPSGLQYKILRHGYGGHHPKKDTSCLCHYAGRLLDGSEFDSSYRRGEPTSFAPSQVIQGWTEAMQLMIEGDKWELYIPSDLAYGTRGSPPKIGPDQTLVFIIEMLDILDDGMILAKDRCDVLQLWNGVSQDDICQDKMSGYVAKMKTKYGNNMPGLEREWTRVDSLLSKKSMKEGELMDWMYTRRGILERIISKGMKANDDKEL